MEHATILKHILTAAMVSMTAVSLSAAPDSPEMMEPMETEAHTVEHPGSGMQPADLLKFVVPIVLVIILIVLIRVPRPIPQGNGGG